MCHAEGPCRVLKEGQRARPLALRYTPGMASEPKLRLRVVLGDAVAIGPGKADLLAGIAESGSIAAAGRRMGMSYKRAWTLIDGMNRCFATPLVEGARGGARGGGARLTALGEEVLALYRRMEARAGTAVCAEIERLHTLIAEFPKPGGDVA
jgi:molybdate transport system regulatory protein